jgi:hypothetical protein
MTGCVKAFEVKSIFRKRDKDTAKACSLLRELSGRFPQNGLYAKEEQKRCR